MPRKAVDEMSVTQLNKRVREIDDRKRKPGLIRVGGVGGLALNVRLRRYASGEALSASWVLRRTVNGARRDFALGAWPEVSLSAARERARLMLDQIWQGIDPAEEKRAARAAQQPKAPTFRTAAQDHFNRAVRGRITVRDEGKWFNDLEAMAFDKIGDLPVDQIEPHHMLAIAEQPYTRYGSKVEQKLWDAVPERARRLFKKVEAILAAETRLGHRNGANPAAQAREEGRQGPARAAICAVARLHGRAARPRAVAFKPRAGVPDPDRCPFGRGPGRDVG
jgi:hypothetical protein